jgi:hypothetical protein
MKRDVALGTVAALAVAAVVGISTQPRRSPGETSAGSNNPSKSVPQPVVTAGLKRICSDPESLIQKLLLAPSEDVAAPKSCYPDDEHLDPATQKQRNVIAGRLQKRAEHLHFVIATLPDPLHSHLSLSFDRKIEAIQQAALDANFDYDSSWLPWETSDPSFTHLKDQDTSDDRKDDREDQPGIILFRKRSNRTEVGKQIDKTEDIFNTGLVVFVVGEEATRGIHRRQFQNAAAWIQALNPLIESSSVGLLSPSFSGSLPSLAQLLTDPDVQGFLKYPQVLAPEDHLHQLRVYSGSVTAKDSVEAFGHWTKSDHLLTNWRVHFHSFVEDDDSVINEYCRYLMNKGLEWAQDDRKSYIALVSEDETAYGAGGLAQQRPNPPKSGDEAAPRADGQTKPPPTPKERKQIDPCSGAVRVFFPRDISALRSAYQARSLFSTGSQSSQNPNRSLPADLADPARETHDTIRSYSDDQLALAQEAQLFGIIGVLRDHHAEILIIRSTNVLDQIFLVQFFRRYYPEGRIALRGADNVFIRQQGYGGMSEVTTLSSYPLIPWDWRDWPNPWDRELFIQPFMKVNPTHRIFGEETVEGTYIAARFLLQETFRANPDIPDPLGGDTSPVCSPKTDDPEGPKACFLPANLSAPFDIPDYKAPFWALRKNVAETCTQDPTRDSCKVYLRPAIWISVLGRDNFYPLLARVPEAGADEPDLHHPLADPRFAVPAETRILLVWLIVFAVFHVSCCYAASFTAKPAFLAHFATLNGWFSNEQSTNSWQHPALITIGSAVIGCSALVLAWGCGGFSIYAPHPDRVWLMWAFLLGALAISFSSIWLSHYSAQRLQDSAGGGITSFDLTWTTRGFWGAVTAFAVFLGGLEHGMNFENRIPTYWRSMNLASGVCPPLPLLLLFGGIYIWFWNSLHGLALFGRDRPLLPREDMFCDPQGKVVPTLRMFGREANAEAEYLAFPLRRNTFVLAFRLFAAIGIGAWYIAGFRTPLRSLGSYVYALVFSLLLDVCVSWMLAEVCQFVLIWTELKCLLSFLDRLTLRRTMKALHGFSWGNVWRMSGTVLDVRYKLLSRQIEALNHLHASCEQFVKSANTYELRVKAVAVADCRDEIGTAHKALQAFATKYSAGYDKRDFSDFRTLERLQERIAAVVGNLLTLILIPAWRNETESLVYVDARTSGEQSLSETKKELADVPEHIRNAEELVCITYLGFVQNILGRLRAMALGMMWFFLAITLSVSTYPFDPRPALNQALTFVFILMGGIVVYVWAAMHRDSTLSRVTNTTPGELGMDFWFKIVGFGAGPFLGLVSYLFPGITDFLFSWLQPGLSALR